MVNYSMRLIFQTILCLALLLSGGAAYSQASPANCPSVEKKLSTQEGTLSYLQVGKGATILLLHGLFAQKEQWIEVACALANQGYEVIAPDLPGYGASVGFPVSVYSLETQVKKLHQFLGAIQVSSVHIAGSSMGGAIAAMYAAQYPNEIKSLAFIGAPLGVIGWSPQVRDAIFNGINPFIPINQEQFNLEMSLLFYQVPQIDPTVSAALIKEYVDNNRHYQQVWDIVNFYDAVLMSGRFYRGPTLILWGEQDGIFNVAGLPALKKHFPQSQAQSVQDASHLLMLDQPKKVVDIYGGFLRR